MTKDIINPRKLQVKSILVRTCIWVAIIAFSISFLFFYVYSSQKTIAHNNEIQSSYLNEIKNTSTAIEVTLDSIAQVMNSVIHEESLVSAMIVPGSEKITRTQRVTGQLQNIVDNYELVEKALLYIPTDNTVYSSELSLMPVTESENAAFISGLEHEKSHILTKNENSGDVLLCSVNNEIVMCEPFFASHLKQIGLLIFILDWDYFNSLFNNLGFAGDGSISVTDNDGNRVIGKNDSSDRIEYLSESDRIASGNYTVFSYLSPRTGWTYYGTVNKKIVTSSGTNAVSLALGIIFVLGMCFVAVRRLYNPVKLLVTNVRKHRGETRPDIVMDEIAFLNQAYDAAYDAAEEEKGRMAMIRPVIIERLFANVLIDQTITEEEIRTTLLNINDPISFDGHYVVVDVSVFKGDEYEPCSEYELSMYLVGIRDLLKVDIPDGVVYSVIRMPNRSMAIVFSFDSAYSSERIKSIITEIGARISLGLTKSPDHTAVGFGSVYRYITDIPYSYNEALQDCERRSFYGDEANSTTKKENIDTLKEFYTEQVRRILLYLNEGNYTQAIIKAKQACATIAKDGDANGIEFQRFVNLTIDRVVAQKLLSMEDLLAERSELEKNFQNFNTTTQMSQYVETFFVKTINMIEQRVKTKRFQNILRIREYVDQNYSDRDLSLSGAAAFVGISTAYASRLFKEEMNVAFVDYINAIRVEHAKHLLQNSDLPVKEIGFRVGFNTEQNFFRVFKKITNASPGVWRSKEEK